MHVTCDFGLHVRMCSVHVRMCGCKVESMHVTCDFGLHVRMCISECVHVSQNVRT